MITARIAASPCGLFNRRKEAMKNTLRALLELALLGVLAVFLIVVIRSYLGAGKPPQAYPAPLASQTIPPGRTLATGTPAIFTPIPLATDTQLANPANVPPIPSSTPFNSDAYPYNNPLATLPPYPTPTLLPGPSPTPIPFVQPAKDASGTLVYFVKQGASAGIETLALDATGATKAAAVRLPNKTTQGNVYYSPDGSRLAQVVSPFGSTIILDVSTGKKEENFHQSGAEIEDFLGWFPDNRHVVLRANSGSLWLEDSFSSEYLELFVPGYGSVFGAAASPDGYKVVYSYQREMTKPSEVWMVNSDGRDTKLLFEVLGVPVNFAWSPDGSKIAFYGDGLKVMDADGSNLQQVGKLACGWGYPLPPAWSPDSRMLAVSCPKKPYLWNEAWTEKIFEGSNIYLIDIKSGEQRLLLPDGSTGNLDPAWSPDGTQIAFVSNRSGTAEVWAVNADGSNLRQLTHNGQIVRFPFWRRW
jgi:hypothetical protein